MEYSLSYVRITFCYGGYVDGMSFSFKWFVGWKFCRFLIINWSIERESIMGTLTV